MAFREAKEWDLEGILATHRAAFPDEDVAHLVEALLVDETALPMISFVALKNGEVVGHSLFTAAGVKGTNARAMLLAPLAVRPDLQKKGFGTEMVARTLVLAQTMGTELVFVLGHPSYYPRIGFLPAIPLHFEAPYPIAPQNHDAWMVLELSQGAIGRYRGTVVCADALMKPEYWRE